MYIGMTYILQQCSKMHIDAERQFPVFPKQLSKHMGSWSVVTKATEEKKEKIEIYNYILDNTSMKNQQTSQILTSI